MFVRQNVKLMNKFLPIILALATLVACEKSTDDNPNGTISQVNSSDEIVVPEGFDFSMTKEATVRLSIFASPFYGKTLVEVYTLKRGVERQTFGKYFVNPVDTVSLDIVVPKTVDGVLLEARTATGEILAGQFTLGNTQPTILESKVDFQEPTQATSTQKMMTISICDTGCTTTISSATGSQISVPAGTIACITGGLSGKELMVNMNATARICGSHTDVAGINLQQGAKLILNDNAEIIMRDDKGITFNINNYMKIGEGALFECGDGSSNPQDLRIHQTTVDNYGEIIVRNADMKVEQSSTLTNYENGIVRVKKEDFKVTGNGEVMNYGLIRALEGFMRLENDSKVTNKGTGRFVNVAEDVIMIGNAAFYNYGEFLIRRFSTPGGDLDMNNDSKFYNYCNTTINDDLIMDGNAYFYNGAGLYVVDDIELNAIGTELEMLPGTIASAGDKIEVDGTISTHGLSSGAFIKSVNQLKFYNGSNVIGPVNYCLQNNSIYVGATANTFSLVEDCNFVVGTDTCVTIGNGSSPDADNDGIPDADDDYPNDPERAEDVTRAPATLIAEDMWPFKGDYDFNDLVLLYRWNYVIDASSNIKEITFRYQVKARGAAHDNGFAFSFDTDESNVESVTGGIYVNNFITLNSNGTEASSSSSTSSCFVITDKLENNLPLWNTYPNEPMSTPVWIDFRIVFTNAIDPAVLNTFNPFMISQKRRQVEIHLAHYMPTNLVDTDFFGRADDASDIANGISYVTSDGMPWVLEVPEDFQYVIENIDLSQAYVNFPLWVQSSGSSAADWYDWQVSNNINGSNLISGGN